MTNLTQVFARNSDHMNSWVVFTQLELPLIFDGLLLLGWVFGSFPLLES